MSQFGVVLAKLRTWSNVGYLSVLVYTHIEVSIIRISLKIVCDLVIVEMFNNIHDCDIVSVTN
ncbi:MAG: hypothetical protein J6Z27_01300 [Bacteroidales bacterium]|nr:hypothetical protein [Bacteroidales bacterium]